jgi:hypothetical protein
MAIMAIQVTDTDIIRTDTTDHIGTMAIPGDADTTGTTGTGFTAITVIIMTIATNLAKDKDRLSWLGHRFEPAFFAQIRTQILIASLDYPPLRDDEALTTLAACPKVKSEIRLRLLRIDQRPLALLLVVHSDVPELFTFRSGSV